MFVCAEGPPRHLAADADDLVSGCVPPADCWGRRPRSQIRSRHLGVVATRSVSYRVPIQCRQPQDAAPQPWAVGVVAAAVSFDPVPCTAGADRILFTLPPQLGHGGAASLILCIAANVCSQCSHR